MKKIVSLFFVIAFLFSFLNVHADEQAFLSANKKKKGVVTTASGLQYEIVKKGNGQKPTTANQVRVHYIGTLIDGTEFDNSYKRGAAPTVFPLNAVIKGWQEGLQLMNVGSTYKLYIPSVLAYGKTGTGKLIKPNETLIFTVDLIGILGVDDPQATQNKVAATTIEKPVQTETKKQDAIQRQTTTTKPAVKTTTAVSNNSTSFSTEFDAKVFEADIISILTNPNNNFSNIIGEVNTAHEKNYYSVHYKTTANISGVGEGEKIVKYPSEKKWVYYATSDGMSKPKASELIDKVLKEMKKLKLPYSYTETVQYNLPTRRLITLNFLNEYKQPVGMEMDIDGLAGSDTEGAGWQITIRVSKKLTAM